MSDIVDLITADHEEQRRRFAHIESVTDPTAIRRQWTPLCTLLELHAAAEEESLYERVARIPDGGEQARDGVHEHNEIRNAIGEAGEHEPGSELFLLAVRQAKAANDHHMAEEEKEVLPNLRAHVDEGARQELGQRFEEFKRAHEGARGISAERKDPNDFVARAQVTR